MAPRGMPRPAIRPAPVRRPVLNVSRSRGLRPAVRRAVTQPWASRGKKAKIGLRRSSRFPLSGRGPRKPRFGRYTRRWPRWRRYPYWRGTVWGGGYAGVPPLDFHPEAFSEAARAELARLGLLKGVWERRVESGGPALAAFVNRFYRAAGFEHVVRAYFGGKLLRRTARLAMRLAFRLASGKPGAWRWLSFERLQRAAVGGGLVSGLALMRGNHRYLLLPWPRLDPAAVRRQRRLDLLRYGQAAPLRWVLDRRQLRANPRGWPSPRQLAPRVRDMIGSQPGAESLRVLLR